MTPTDPPFVHVRTAPFRAAVTSATLALALSACTLHGNPEVALATPEVTAPATAGSGRPAVKTVRPSAASAADEVAEAPLSAVPAPRQIFDFHPTGAKPDDWRQPFIIDPNDGPLAADVRRSSAELRSYRAATDHGQTSAVARRCGENAVATATPGCAGPAVTAGIPKPSNPPASPTP